MPDLDEIRNGIIVWARWNGLLVDNFALDQSMEGDKTLCPFSDESIQFFRSSRRIVRITCKDKLLTIFSRQKVAEPKIQKLKEEFSNKYADSGFSLAVLVSGFYRVNQQVGSSVDPIRYHSVGRKKYVTCGSSIGLGNQRNAGTLGALARKIDEDDDLIYGLSCNHVLGGCSTTPPGTPVVIPGIRDVSYLHDTITVVGSYEAAAPMSQGLPTVTNRDQNYDLAAFQLTESGLLSSRQGSGSRSYDTPTKFIAPTLDMEVKKWGRTTGLTTGFVSAITEQFEGIDYDVISYSGPSSSERFKGTVYFRYLIEIDPLDGGSDGFSAGGDSGALVVTEDGTKAVGMVIGGAGGKGIVMPLSDALSEVGLELVASVHS